MKEFRCLKCRRLLGRYRECRDLEIKCPRCGLLNRMIEAPASPVWALCVENRDSLDSSGHRSE